MPTFQYTALSRSGGLVRGSMEAASDAEVRDRLQANSCRLLDVWALASDIAPRADSRPRTLEAVVAEAAVADAAGGPPAVPLAGARDIAPQRVLPVRQGVVVPARALAQVYRDLAVNLRSGVPVHQSVLKLRLRVRHPDLARALADMETAILQGRPLSEAMARHPRAFRHGHVGMVRVGEGSGGLPAAFEALANHMDADWGVESSLRYNPLFFIVRWVATPILALAFLAVFPFSGWDVLAAVAALSMLVMVCMLAYPMLDAGIRRVPGGGAFLDRLNRLPVLGARRTRSERVHTLGALVAGLEAGVPLGVAWDLAADAADAENTRAAMLAQRGRIRRGESISDALAATGLYDETVLQAARYGEYVGHLPQSLSEIIAYDRKEAALIGALIPWVVATIAYFLYLIVGTWLVLHLHGV